MQTALEQILKGRRSQPHQVIEVLHDIQDSFGYIPEDAMRTVSKELGVPLIEVYRVASFYKAFKLTKQGKYLITICMGTACHVRGAKLLMDQAATQLGLKPNDVSDDGLFSYQHVNCLGACALGPIVTVNGKYYRHMNPAKLRRLIRSLKQAEEGSKNEEN